MSQFGRAVGLLRSLAVYHAIPFRQRRLRRLYARFVERGDLAFDLGAHVGNRTRAMAALGCRVVAVEPQPHIARLLGALFARRPDIEIVEAGVGEHSGRAALSISDQTPTMTTLTTAWRDDRGRDPVFAGVQWNRQVEVETTTLDDLIARFGVPVFVKIDVEGGEPGVLAGLTHAIPALSFEYLPHALDYTDACVTRLNALGSYRFNWSPGESYRLMSEDWLSGHALLTALKTPIARRGSGDVYARLEPSNTTRESREGDAARQHHG
ncbi:MAG TPA: FkbM family methyltransferase [Acidobacteria bacterium]|nr:FkbM family methyltransferase [Acidobacteriota bacterium]